MMGQSVEFSGRCALVTGGTAGLGLALARGLRDAGARVIVCGRRAGPLAAAQAEGFEAIQADLAVDAERDALARACAGRVDLLLHNAGVQREIDLRELDQIGQIDAALRSELTLNLLAPVLLTRALLPSLMAQPRADVVHVTSGLAITPKSSAPMYCASKAGLRSFTRSLRHQLRGSSVRVVEVLPPVTDTEMTAGREEAKASPEAVAAEALAGLAAGREEIRVGDVRWLWALHRVAPGVAERVVLGK